MRIIGKQLDKNAKGRVKLTGENAEDIWNIYNIIQVGDKLTAFTSRKKNIESETGSTTTSVVKMHLTIEVRDVHFDPEASVIFPKGTVAVENPHVKLGAYHTFNIGIKDEFTIEKDCWDSVAIAKLEEASDPSKQSELAAVLMHNGVANVCLVTSSASHFPSKIECNIPRKRTQLPANEHDKAKQRFFDQIIQAMESNIRFDLVKCVLVASPGFLKDEFFEYLFQVATRDSDKHRSVLENKSKFMLVHSATGHKGALKEVLKDPAIKRQIANTKASAEISALDDFYAMLKTNPLRAFYGVNHVERAVEACAVETLLICDSLFRSNDLAERRRYVQIVDSVKENMGNVRIFSSMHISGEDLKNLSGIAAILRFPLPELEEGDLGIEDEEDDSEMEFA
ncbi:unnamed protein product [Hymenolepis diminuta]|uniref:Protein pelota homolog n=1 Tax=Hymenolepis diminuta TaxID=6216 RepID=A0A564YEP9_HYMDI|nr:unnamed protein product [Hymenolepis diminuta]